MLDYRIETGQVGQACEAFDSDLLARLVFSFRNAVSREQNAVAGLKMIVTRRRSLRR